MYVLYRRNEDFVKNTYSRVFLQLDGNPNDDLASGIVTYYNPAVAEYENKKGKKKRKLNSAGGGGPGSSSSAAFEENRIGDRSDTTSTEPEPGSGLPKKLEKLVVGNPPENVESPHGEFVHDNLFVKEIVKCNTLITQHLRCYSDERLKTDKKPMPDGVLATLRKLQQFVYTWTNDGIKDAGPMAQEIFRLFAKNFPGIVTYAKSDEIPNSLEEIKAKGLPDGALVVARNAFNGEKWIRL